MSASILMTHAAQVSLDASVAAFASRAVGRKIRHVLLPGIVDPAATSFAGDDRDFARLRAAVAGALQPSDRRVILSCSVYNGLAERLAADLGLPVERSDDAGVRATLAAGSAIGLAVSYPPSYDVIAAHLAHVAAERSLRLALHPLMDGNAFATAGDAGAYRAALVAAAAAAPVLDVLFLSQFSMDPYAAEVAAASRMPVVSALRACADRLEHA